MKIKQLNSSNMGVKIEEDLPGYRHVDGLYFEEMNMMHIMNHGLSKILIKEFPNAKKVLDIGCGAGSLSKFLRKEDKDLLVVTLDGNPETKNSPFINKDTHFIVRTDLEYDLVDENNKQVKFDLICSFEHLEHIQPSTFKTFLKNIHKHCHQETTIITTAADYVFHEEHEKHIHCLVMPRDQWVGIIESEGFEMINHFPLEKNKTMLSYEWLPPHGRLAVSHQLNFKLRSTNE
jgi:SAM-dependent methyltransferase